MMSSNQGGNRTLIPLRGGCQPESWQHDITFRRL